MLKTTSNNRSVYKKKNTISIRKNKTTQNKIDQSRKGQKI